MQAGGTAADWTPRVDLPAGRVPVRPAEVARRDRILGVALALASRGGYDEVQMREVADRAEVALGTLYRYFPSKAQLLTAALARHLQHCGEEILAELVWAAAPLARARAALDALIGRLGADPALARAMARTLASAAVLPVVGRSRRAGAGAGIEAVAGIEPVAAGAAVSLITAAVFGRDGTLDAGQWQAATIIDKVFLHDLRAWLGGGMTDVDIHRSLTDTLVLVLAGREAVRS